jgi:putative ABC transport system permease protein
VIRIAMTSLFHDRAKLLAALAGVAFASALTVIQVGLYFGFLYTSSVLVSRMGGDVWVMSRGTQVADNMERLAPNTQSFVTSHGCVARVRPLVAAWVHLRTPRGRLEPIQLVGVDPRQPPYMPWEMVQGLPRDLLPPMRIAVDELDLERLQLSDRPVGEKLMVRGQLAHVAGVTRGARPFTLIPYVFAEVQSARRMAQLEDGLVNYWVVDLTEQDCAASYVAHIESQPQLQAVTTADFSEKSQRYWVKQSGAGAILAFSAILGLLVGAVIVGQTLFSVTRAHQRELATLQALGATPGELLGFVGWQGAFLVGVGSAAGVATSALLGMVGQNVGLVVRFTPTAFLLAFTVIAVMCAGACWMSIRQILSIDVGEVFQ